MFGVRSSDMKKSWILCFFLWIVGTLSAAPPPAPSAGIVEREIEKEYDGKPLEPNKNVPAIQIDIPEERLNLPEGRKVFVSCVKVQGNESIPEKKLLAGL